MDRGRRLVGSIAVAGALVVATAGVAAAVVPDRPSSTWQANGRVQVVLRVGQTVYLGGSFTALLDHSGHTVARSHIAAVDASGNLIAGWNPGADGTVFTMEASPDGKTLYVGGAFRHMDGQKRHRIAAFSASSTGGALTSFNADVRGGAVRALAASSTSVYLGGNFKTVDGQARAGLAALASGNGDLSTWYPGAVTGGKVRALSLPTSSSSRLVVGGSFTTIGGSGVSKIGAVSTSNGAIETWNFHPSGNVITMTEWSGYTYAGTQNNLAIRYDPATGGRTWSRHGNGNVQALAVLNGDLYIGGHFQEFNGNPEPHLAAVDASSGAYVNWGASANSILGVYALEGNGNLYMGGDFTKVTGSNQAHFAMFPPT
jgi:hypothetical protein